MPLVLTMPEERSRSIGEFREVLENDFFIHKANACEDIFRKRKSIIKSEQKEKEELLSQPSTNQQTSAKAYNYKDKKSRNHLVQN